MVPALWQYPKVMLSITSKVTITFMDFEQIIGSEGQSVLKELCENNFSSMLAF